MIRGKLQGVSLIDVLPRVLPSLPGSVVFVVRSLDSTTASADIAAALAYHAIPDYLINGNVCVSRDNCEKAAGGKVFTGFDSIWIFKGDPPIDLQKVPCGTSETMDFSLTVPDEIEELMTGGNCLLVLGDGCGLNYATVDERIAREIVRAF